MNRWRITYLLSLLIGLSSLLANCHECSCGTIPDDPIYAEVVDFFDSAIRRTGFGVCLGNDFPSVATTYYPPIELREDLEDTTLLKGGSPGKSKTV